MNAIIESHLIPPTTLRADVFKTSYQVRMERLLALIERVLMKNDVAVALLEDINGEKGIGFAP